jgi:hypothetical protein
LNNENIANISNNSRRSYKNIDNNKGKKVMLEEIKKQKIITANTLDRRIILIPLPNLKNQFLKCLKNIVFFYFGKMKIYNCRKLFLKIFKYYMEITSLIRVLFLRINLMQKLIIIKLYIIKIKLIILIKITISFQHFLLYLFLYI